MPRHRKAWVVNNGTGQRYDNGRRLPGYYARYYEYIPEGRRNRSQHFSTLANARRSVKQYNARLELGMLSEPIPIKRRKAVEEFAAGNLVDDHRSYSYTYDHDNRLTNVKKSGAVDVEYQYDALGRRLKMLDTSQFPAVTRYYLSSGQNVVAEYDISANRERYYVHGPTYIDERVVVHDEASNKDYVYLTKDLYTVAGLADEKGCLVESYDYDAYGQPIMSACAILPYAADYDGDGDVDGDDQTVFEAHHNGPGNSPSGTAGWRSDFDCDGDVDGSDYVLFAHAYNGAGETPRGDMTLMTGSMVTSRTANPYFFTGRRLDVYDIQDANTPNHFTDDKAGLVLYYYRARTMDPVLGRLVQADPLGYVDGMNVYEYARSSPLVHVDPQGLSIGCGPLVMSCKNGIADWPVYGDSARARAIFGAAGGCVTLLVPKGIFCTGSCEEIKDWYTSGPGPSVPILDHEACHACAFEDDGFCEYLKSWIPGDRKGYCNHNSIPSAPYW